MLSSNHPRASDEREYSSLCLLLNLVWPRTVGTRAFGPRADSTRSEQIQHSAQGWISSFILVTRMITYNNTPKQGWTTNIQLFSNAEYHRSSLSWEGWIPYSSLLRGMNIIFIPLCRDEYGIHPWKILNSAERGNISTLRGDSSLTRRIEIKRYVIWDDIPKKEHFKKS